VVELRSTSRRPVDWEYQPCYGAFTDLTKDFVLSVSESVSQYGAANGG
jgi:hypothetical protein